MHDDCRFNCPEGASFFKPNLGKKLRDLNIAKIYSLVNGYLSVVHLLPIVTAHRAPHIRSRSLWPVFKGAYLCDQSGLRMNNTLRRPYHENLSESPFGRLPAPCNQLQLQGVSEVRTLTPLVVTTNLLFDFKVAGRQDSCGCPPFSLAFRRYLSADDHNKQ